MLVNIQLHITRCTYMSVASYYYDIMYIYIYTTYYYNKTSHVPILLLEDLILILSTHLRLRLSSGLFPSGFSTKILCAPLPSSAPKYVPRISYIFIWWPKHYVATSLSLMCSPPVFCYLVHLRPERLPTDTILNTVRVSHQQKATGKIILTLC